MLCVHAAGRQADLMIAPVAQDSLKLSTQPEPHGRASLSSPRTPRGTEVLYCLPPPPLGTYAATLVPPMARYLRAPSSRCGQAQQSPTSVLLRLSSEYQSDEAMRKFEITRQVQCSESQTAVAPHAMRSAHSAPRTISFAALAMRLMIRIALG